MQKIFGLLTCNARYRIICHRLDSYFRELNGTSDKKFNGWC